MAESRRSGIELARLAGPVSDISSSKSLVNSCSAPVSSVAESCESKLPLRDDAVSKTVAGGVSINASGP